jgi:hypothetical protein
VFLQHRHAGTAFSRRQRRRHAGRTGADYHHVEDLGLVDVLFGKELGPGQELQSGATIAAAGELARLGGSGLCGQAGEAQRAGTGGAGSGAGEEAASRDALVQYPGRAGVNPYAIV